MEEEIEDYLKESYRLKLEVKFKEFRHYDIIIKFDSAECKISFTYDTRFTFEVNMESLKRYIDKCILEYFKGGVKV